MLWITVSSGCFAFVFQQPMGIGLEIRLARGPDFQRMTKGATGDEVVRRRRGGNERFRLGIKCDGNIFLLCSYLALTFFIHRGFIHVTRKLEFSITS